MNTCKYCGEKPEDCTCQKVRLLLRKGVADAEGRLAEYEYKTVITFIPSQDDQKFEVIGGEYLKKETPTS